MAKHPITRACGHPAVLHLGGRSRDREWRAKREAEKLCADCYRADQERRRADESAAAAQRSAAEGLPALVGTERQVAWAESIRRQRLDHADRLAADVRAACARMVAAGELAAEGERDVGLALDAALGSLVGQASAGWWIDHRSDLARLDFERDVERACRAALASHQPAPAAST